MQVKQGTRARAKDQSIASVMLSAATIGASLARLPFALALWVSASAAISTAQAAEVAGSAKVPVEAFFRPAEFDKARLSPSGNHLAVVMGSPTGRTKLAVLDLRDMSKAAKVAGFTDADISRFQWVNERRLVFSAVDSQSGSGDQFPPGLWAVNLDGSQFRQLVDRDPPRFVEGRKKNRLLPYNWRLHTILSDGSDDIVVEELRWNTHDDLRSTSLSRLNTVTGEVRSLFPPPVNTPAGAIKWWIDPDGKNAIIETLQEDRGAIHLREPEGAWRKLAEFAAFGAEDVQPLRIDSQGTVYVLAGGPHRVSALFRLDRKTGRPEKEPLARIDGFDFDGQLVLESGSPGPLGIHFRNDARGTVWFDPGMQEVQRKVDTQLPATINMLSCGSCRTGQSVLVASYSDRQPMTYRLFDRASSTLRPLFESRPWIDPSAMARKEFVRYSARDGRSIPAYVTLPVGDPAVRRPAVVLVHGGPYVRGGDWEWEVHAQFLASRGYVVIEPEFRGSLGFGFDHFRAGWKQWGLAMQDDLADAVRWADEKKFIDPKRVCIAGASYGGYAALMGLVRELDPYKCAFQWVGVTDINLMYDISWSDFTRESLKYGMPKLVGDPVLDAKQLAETSPLKNAARVKRPLLMAYGGSDVRVPLKHGTAFKAAVMATNPDVEWVVYPDEGHGWLKLETQVDFWSRVEKFLERNIGGAGLRQEGE